MSFQTRTQSCPTNQMKKELGSHIKERRGAPERRHPGRRGLVHTRPPRPATAPPPRLSTAPSVQALYQ